MFPDTSANPPALSLSTYFDDTRVEALIAVYDEKGTSDSSAISATGLSSQRGGIGSRGEDGGVFGRRGSAVAVAVESAASAVDGVRAAVLGAAGLSRNSWEEGKGGQGLSRVEGAGYRGIGHHINRKGLGQDLIMVGIGAPSEEGGVVVFEDFLD